MRHTLLASLAGLLCLAIITACQPAGGLAAAISASSTPRSIDAPIEPTPTRAAVAGLSAEYTVQAGDNLFRIAQQYGVSLSELARINNITDPAQITVGQKLTIPLGTQPDPATVTPTVTPSPTISPSPSPSPPPSPTRLPSSTPTLSGSPQPTHVPPTDVNGITIDQFVIMPPAVQANMRQIYAAGQALGPRCTCVFQDRRQHDRESAFHGAVRQRPV